MPLSACPVTRGALDVILRGMRIPKRSPEYPSDPRPYKLCENRPNEECLIISEFATAAAAKSCLVDIKNFVSENDGSSVAFEWEVRLVLRSQSVDTIDIPIA